jgi:Icc-related predicted phosphoesterase
LNQAWLPLSKVSADVVVLAGDIHLGINAINFAARMWPDCPVVVVAGNHEFYHGDYHKTLADLRQEADRRSNIHFLENDTLEIGDVVFLGCTLWTDFCLYGKKKEQVCRSKAKQCMADYTQIRNQFSRAQVVFSLLRPEDTAEIHRQSMQWLRDSLASIPPEKKVVVVTHAAPSENSIPEQYQGDILSAAFASNLEGLIQQYQPSLWVHGHTHGHADYMIGATRVIANPKGYPDEDAGFDPELVVAL